MYEVIDGKLTISVNDWMEAGLTYSQYKHDLEDGYLKFTTRSTNGNTRIDVHSIKRHDRLRVIERVYGPIPKDKDFIPAYDRVEYDPAAEIFFNRYRYGDDNKTLLVDAIKQYINEASILNSVSRMYYDSVNELAKYGKSVCKKKWLEDCVELVVRNMEVYPNKLPLNPRRFEQKYNEYRKEGYESLIHKNFGTNNSEKLSPSAKEWIVARYATPVNRCTLEQLYEEYSILAPVRGWKDISAKNTLYAYLNRPEVKPLWFGARNGELLAKEKYARQNKTILPTVRDSVWYGDGTKLNFFYRDEKGNRATCNVYEVVDAYSEVLLGYHISATEDFEAQYHAYRMAIEFAGHKPYEIRFDNQGGHKKLQAGSFMSRIARLAIATQPYNGKSKTIESVFGRLQSQFLSREWYFTGQNVTAKKLDSKANMEFILANTVNLPTLDEVRAKYAEYRNMWNEAPHYKTGRRRIDMYLESVNPKSPEVGITDRISMFGIKNEKTIKYRSNGILMQFKGQKYQWEVLTSDGVPDMDFLRKNVDRDFYLEYDPEDMSYVCLYEKAPDGKTRFAAIASKYIEIHRGKQDQDNLDNSFIRHVEHKNKALRIDMQEQTERLMEKEGLHPAQHGLNMPKVKGINKTYKAKDIGQYLKEESLATPGGDIRGRY